MSDPLDYEDDEVVENEPERDEDVAQADVEPEVRRDYVPTEADYERARNEGIGNEPELPPGKVKGRVIEHGE